MSGEKLPPSPSKLRKLRTQGVVPGSPVLPQAAATLAFLLIAWGGLPPAVEALRSCTLALLSGLPLPLSELRTPLITLVVRCTLPFAGAAIVGMGVALIQRKGAIKPPTLSLASLKPFAGFFSRFSAEQCAAFAIRALAGTALVFTIYRTGTRLASEAARSGSTSAGEFPRFVAIFAVVTLVAAILDAAARGYFFRQKHGMPPHEAKQEHREQEGAPELKAALHHARMEMMHAPPAKAMRQAEVVIRNPTHIAVAITGIAENDPWVLMSGDGARAQTLLRLARRYGRPTIRSVALARQLHRCGEGADVPPQLIAAVAEAARWAQESQSSR